jgi:hypothetical protein
LDNAVTMLNMDTIGRIRFSGKSMNGTGTGRRSDNWSIL